MERIQTVEIQDPVYEETYTAHIQKNGAAWIGWIPEVPEVECEENTREALLKTLVKDLHEALAAEQKAWEKQFEADVKAGHLDYLSEKALKNFREGRYYELEKLQELLAGVTRTAGRCQRHCCRYVSDKTPRAFCISRGRSDSDTSVGIYPTSAHE